MSQSAPHPFVTSPFSWRAAARRALSAVRQRAAWLDCLALLALAAVIRAIGLWQLPLWSDELFTVFWAQLSPDYLLGPGAAIDATPPLYYVLMHQWMALFGSSPAAVHVPSFIFSATTVPLVYLAAARLFDRKIALLAGLFAAVNPFAVMYAQEVRCYALLGFVDGLAFLALAAQLRRPAARDLEFFPWPALLVAALIGGVLIHYTSVLFLAACLAAVAFDLARRKPYDIKTLVIWAGLALFTCAVAAWLLLQAQPLMHDARIAWIPPMSPSVAIGFLLAVVTDPQAAGLTAWAGAGALALVILAGWRRLEARRAQWLLLAALPLLCCALLFAASLARPAAIPRVGIWLPIPLSILLAACVMRAGRAWARLALALIVLAAWLVPLAQYIAKPGKEDWRTAALVTAKLPRCGGPILYIDNSGLGLVYYQPALTDRALYTISLTKVAGGYAPVPIAVKRQDILQQTYLHPNYLYFRQVPAFISAHPHTALVLLPGYGPLLQVLPSPTLVGRLAGGLTMACY